MREYDQKLQQMQGENAMSTNSKHQIYSNTAIQNDKVLQYYLLSTIPIQEVSPNNFSSSSRGPTFKRAKR